MAYKLIEVYIMKIIRSKKGFTLIELAIVMVIIGIILGAVLKGQDLIESARHKMLTNEVKRWEALTWGCMDRRGVFPGDAAADWSGRDGIIDQDPKTDLMTRCRFEDPPSENTVVLGGHTFYLWLGNDGGTPKKNIIAITKDTTPSVFNSAEIAYMESIDTSIDGIAKGDAGRVRAATGTGTLDGTKWYIPRATVSGTWTPNTTKALVYYFEKK
jgi:prepilin-type N-terminal cleavage/methylation domain-containing protein